MFFFITVDLKFVKLFDDIKPPMIFAITAQTLV